MTRRVLVAGIGNIFLGDDGFGVEVANRLKHEQMPAAARVEEFGIRGVHLAYELLDGYDALVLIDAIAMGESPGTVCVVSPEREPLGAGDASALDAHTMNPDVVLATLSKLGAEIEEILIVGCEPAVLDEGIGLSDQVEAAIAPAVKVCLEIVNKLCSDNGKESAA